MAKTSSTKSRYRIHLSANRLLPASEVRLQGDGFIVRPTENKAREAIEMVQRKQYATDYTAMEQMVIAAARQVSDTDVVYVGVGLPMASGVLAKHLNAPNCTIIIENGIVRQSLFPAPRATDTLGSQSYAEQLSGLFY